MQPSPRDLVYHFAVEISECRAEYDQDSYKNYGDKQNDQRIFDQTLPFLTRQEKHRCTSSLCTLNS
jgi:hypothetical protein